MSYLYAALFSNGIIKVGRSVHPRARIAQHEAALKASGVTLRAFDKALCKTRPVVAEAALIALCAAAAAKRDKSEWFHGLDFLRATDWMNSCAEQEYPPPPDTPIQRAIDAVGSPAKLAAAVGFGALRQHVEHWLRAGRVPAEHCHDVEALTGVPCWDLRPTDWWLIWPNKVGAYGAPSTHDTPAPAA